MHIWGKTKEKNRVFSQLLQKPCLLFTPAMIYLNKKIHNSMAKKLTLLNKEAKLKEVFSNIFENFLACLKCLCSFVLATFDSIILKVLRPCFLVLSFYIDISRKPNHPNLCCSHGKDTEANTKNRVLPFLKALDCKIGRLTN